MSTGERPSEKLQGPRRRIELIAPREVQGLKKLDVKWSSDDIVSVFALGQDIRSGLSDASVASGILGMVQKAYVPFVKTDIFAQRSSVDPASFYESAKPYVKDIREIFEVMGVFEGGEIKSNVVASLEHLPPAQSAGITAVLNLVRRPEFAVDPKHAIYSFLQRMDPNVSSNDFVDAENLGKSLDLLGEYEVSPSMIKFVVAQTMRFNPTEDEALAQRVNSWFGRLNSDWTPVGDETIEEYQLQEIERAAYQYGLSHDVLQEETIAVKDIQPLGEISEEEGRHFVQLYKAAKESLVGLPSEDYSLDQVEERAHGTQGVEAVTPMYTVVRTFDYHHPNRPPVMTELLSGNVLVDTNGNAVVDPRQQRQLLFESIERLGDDAGKIYDALKDKWISYQGHYTKLSFYSEGVYDDAGLDEVRLLPMEFPLLLEKEAKEYEKPLTKRSYDYFPGRYYDFLLEIATSLEGVSPVFTQLREQLASGRGQQQNILDCLTAARSKMGDRWQTVVDAYRVAEFIHGQDKKRNLVHLWQKPQTGEEFVLPGVYNRVLLAVRKPDLVTPWGTKETPLRLNPNSLFLVTGPNGNGKTKFVATVADLQAAGGLLPVHAIGSAPTYPEGAVGIDIDRPSVKGLSHFQTLALHAFEALSKGGRIFADEPGGTARDIQVAITVMEALLSTKGFLISHDGQKVIEEARMLFQAAGKNLPIEGMMVREFQPTFGVVTRSSGGLHLLDALGFPEEFWDVKNSAERKSERLPFVDFETAERMGFNDILELSLRHFPGILPKNYHSRAILKQVVGGLRNKLFEKAGINEEVLADGIFDLTQSIRSQGGVKKLLDVLGDPRKTRELHSLVERASKENAFSLFRPDTSPALNTLRELLVGHYLLRIANGEGSFFDIHGFKAIGKDGTKVVLKNLVKQYPALVGLNEQQIDALTDRTEQFLATPLNLQGMIHQLQLGATQALHADLMSQLMVTGDEQNQLVAFTAAQQEIVALQGEIGRVHGGLSSADLAPIFSSLESSDSAFRSFIDTAFSTASRKFYDERKARNPHFNGEIYGSFLDFRKAVEKDIATNNIQSIGSLLKRYFRNENCIAIGKEIVAQSDSLPEDQRQDAIQFAVALALFGQGGEQVSYMEADWLRKVAESERNPLQSLDIPSDLRRENIYITAQQLGIPPEAINTDTYRLFAQWKTTSLDEISEEQIRRKTLPDRLAQKQKVIAQLQQNATTALHKKALHDAMVSLDVTAANFIAEVDKLSHQAEQFIFDRAQKDEMHKKRNDMHAVAQNIEAFARSINLTSGSTIEQMAHVLSTLPQDTRDEKRDEMVRQIELYIASLAQNEILKSGKSTLSEATFAEANDGINILYAGLSMGKLMAKLGSGQVRFDGNRIRLANAIPLHVIADKLQNKGVWPDLISDEDLDRVKREVTPLTFDTGSSDAEVLLGVGHNAAGKTTVLKTIGTYEILGKLLGVVPGKDVVLPQVDGVSYVSFGETRNTASAFTQGAIDALQALQRAKRSRQLILTDEAFSGSDELTEREATLRFLQTSINAGSLPFAVLFERSIYNTLREKGVKTGVVGFSQLYRPQMSNRFIEPNSLEIMRQMGFPQPVVDLTAYLVERQRREKQASVA